MGNLISREKKAVINLNIACTIESWRWLEIPVRDVLETEIYMKEISRIFVRKHRLSEEIPYVITEIIKQYRTENFYTFVYWRLRKSYNRELVALVKNNLEIFSGIHLYSNFNSAFMIQIGWEYLVMVAYMVRKDADECLRSCKSIILKHRLYGILNEDQIYRINVQIGILRLHKHCNAIRLADYLQNGLSEYMNHP